MSKNCHTEKHLKLSVLYTGAKSHCPVHTSTKSKYSHSLYSFIVSVVGKNTNKTGTSIFFILSHSPSLLTSPGRSEHTEPNNSDLRSCFPYAHTAQTPFLFSVASTFPDLSLTQLFL